MSEIADKGTLGGSFSPSLAVRIGSCGWMYGRMNERRKELKKQGPKERRKGNRGERDRPTDPARLKGDLDLLAQSLELNCRQKEF